MTKVVIKAADGTGSVELYNNAVKVFETTDSGISITGQSKGVCTHNLILNGAMLVDQRNSGSAYTGTTSMVMDQWKMHVGGQDENPTGQQHALTKASDALPWAAGLRYSFLVTNGNQTSGAGSSDYLGLIQHVEAYNARNSGWDYNSTSSYITLSFWVKSSVAQNFYGYLRTPDGTSRAYIFETGNLTADTWTKITKTIPGDSNITINNDTGAGLSFYLHAYWGTNYTGSVSLNQWGNYAGTTRTPDYGTANDDWWLTNNATLELTGVQIELGQVANDFKPEVFTEELQKCKRYYQKSYEYQDAPGNNTAAGIVLERFGGSSAITNRTDLAIRWEVEMRLTPTVIVYSKVGTSGSCSDWQTGTTHVADRAVDSVLGNSTKGNRGLDMNSAQDDALAYHYVANSEL